MLRYGWSLEKDSWLSISPDLSEASWQKIRCLPDSSVLVPESRGIYMFIFETKDIIKGAIFESLCSPLYVGHSLKLRQRFKQHTIGNRDNIRNTVVIFIFCI